MEVDPSEGAGAAGVPAGVQNRWLAVGVVDVSLVNGTRRAEDGGHVPVGVLLDVEALATAVALDHGVHVDRAPDVLDLRGSAPAFLQELPRGGVIEGLGCAGVFGDAAAQGIVA